MNNHLRNMFAYFAVATAVVIGLGVGTTITGSWLIAFPAVLAIAAFTAFGGITITMQLRQRLNLVQTGRVVQYASFIASAFLALTLCGWLLGSTFAVANALCTASALFVAAFAPATIFGEVPWHGRTWLPVRRK